MTFRLCKVKTVLLGMAVLMLIGIITVAAGSVSERTGGKASGELVLGDANCDGDVNINDVTCIQMVLAQWSVNQGYSEASADIDGNGRVEIFDATLLQQWLAEMTVTYSIGKPLEAVAESTQAATQSPTDEEGWGREIFRP